MERAITFTLRVNDQYGTTRAVLVASDGERECETELGFAYSIPKNPEEWSFACLKNSLYELFAEDRCGACGR